MKKQIELFIFNLKKDMWVYIGIIGILYIVVVPLFMYKIDDYIYLGYDVETSLFALMQRILFMFIISFQYFMFQIYVKSEMKELSLILDLKSKWVYLFIECMFFHIVLLPLYILINIKVGNMINIFAIFLFQSFVLSSIFYLLSMSMRSSLLSLGIIVCYILIFSYFENIISLFIIEESVPLISYTYFIKWIFIMIFNLIIGRKFEKKFKK
jgi:hypothetical protein